jgi:divinyl protochlorophyllide a 8-vinyl-reductase
MNEAISPARIGPNAVIRLVEALDACESRSVTARIFNLAGVEDFIANPPGAMVPEKHVTELHHQLRDIVGTERSRSVSWIAGLRTADYLLAHRIPKPVQRLLKLLPVRIGAFILLKAIGNHAWTFAGSGTFSWKLGNPVVLTISDCPLCRGDTATAPCCHYYAATFERLFRELINSNAVVIETECIASGAPACRFEIR